MTCRLWIEDSRMSDSEIREAVWPAEAAIREAGFTVEEAYQASLFAADDQPYDAAAMLAWEEAERIALEGVAAERAVLSVA